MSVVGVNKGPRRLIGSRWTRPSGNRANLFWGSRSSAQGRLVAHLAYWDGTSTRAVSPLLLPPRVQPVKRWAGEDRPGVLAPTLGIERRDVFECGSQKHHLEAPIHPILCTTAYCGATRSRRRGMRCAGANECPPPDGEQLDMYCSCSPFFGKRQKKKKKPKTSAAASVNRAVYVQYTGHGWVCLN